MSGDDRPTDLQRIGSGGLGWRGPALMVALVLVGVVAAARVGAPDRGPSTGLPDLTPLAPASPDVALVEPTPGADAEAGEPTPATPDPSSEPQLGTQPAADPVSAPPRYRDGIPSMLDDEPVYRLDMVLSMRAARDRLVLIGGWFEGRRCAGRTDPFLCRAGRLADNPLELARRDGGIQVFDGSPVVELSYDPAETGARIIRGRIGSAACRGRGECIPAIVDARVAWRGDPLTETGPIEVVPLFDSLAVAFPELHPVALREDAQCPTPWPPQAYRSAMSGVRMAIVYPTVADRERAEGAVKVGQRVMLIEEGGRCLGRDVRRQQSTPTTWIVHDNVMLLVDSSRTLHAELARAALADARQRSRTSVEVEHFPITTWEALRRLWRWSPTLDLLPPSVLEACGVEMPANSHLVNDGEVFALIVFPNSAERRTTRSGPAGVRRCTADGVAPPSRLRWVGYQNLLLAVRETTDVDALRSALGGVRADRPDRPAGSSPSEPDASLFGGDGGMGPHAFDKPAPGAAAFAGGSVTADHAEPLSHPRSGRLRYAR